MAKLALKIRQSRPQKFETRQYNRCQLCGRPRGYYRKFKICRLCFRDLALKGEIPGLRKSSW
jgi:small subunit ribosomal protein S14